MHRRCLRIPQSLATAGPHDFCRARPAECCTARRRWRHRGARDGFEVLFVEVTEDGYRCEGAVAALEGGCWAARYCIVLDRSWTTRLAQVSSLTAAGGWELRLEANGQGSWWKDGAPAADLDGCLDVDLEASVFTSALPVHRLRLAVGASADAPAAYARALEPRVERLEQYYTRLADEARRRRLSPRLRRGRR
jgi:uncharacterized protein